MKPGDSQGTQGKACLRHVFASEGLGFGGCIKWKWSELYEFRTKVELCRQERTRAIAGVIRFMTLE